MVKEGQELGPIVKEVKQERIDQYTGYEEGLVETDPEVAREAGFPDTIVPGVMQTGHLSQLMFETFERRWLETGTMSVTFVDFANPGDELHISGEVTDVTDDTITVDLVIENQNGETVVPGTATVDTDP